MRDCDQEAGIFRLLEQIGLYSRACSIVYRDRRWKKPDLEPIFHALAQCGSRVENSLYVGDASRDIEAGRNVNMNDFIGII